MTSRKSCGRGKVERYVQGELCEVLGRGKKKRPKRQSIKSQHQKKKPLKKAEEKAEEKKPNDFESTDDDRITCKGTHCFMGA